nr:hypothetical protein [Rhizobium leguminosarum]
MDLVHLAIDQYFHDRFDDHQAIRHIFERSFRRVGSGVSYVTKSVKDSYVFRMIFTEFLYTTV